MTRTKKTMLIKEEPVIVCEECNIEFILRVVLTDGTTIDQSDALGQMFCPYCSMLTKKGVRREQD